jgi:hypothetical protein
MKTINTTSKLTAAIFLALGLSACNIELNVDGKKVAEVNATKVNATKTGVITTIDGKVVVNGTSYDTQNATVVVDGVQTDASDLKNGMVVSVSGTESSDGTGTAKQIIFEDEVEGIVKTNSATAASNGSINVLGQTVHVDANTVFESYDVSDLSVGDIDEGNIVEVSGYSSGKGEIWATRIEVKNIQYNPGEVVELKGIVSNLGSTTFNIGNLTINIENAALDSDFMGTLQNGQYVKVSSIEGVDANGNLIASEIELKSESSKEVNHDDNDEQVEIKGAITKDLTTNDLNNKQLEINGSTVLLDSNLSISNNLTKGVIVEAEGYVNAEGVFVAIKLKLENDSDSGSDSESDSDLSQNPGTSSGSDSDSSSESENHKSDHENESDDND